MILFIIYTVISLSLLAIFIMTKRYKRNIFKNIDKKENPFRISYGMAAAVIDFFDLKIHRISYENIEKKLDKIKVNNYDKKDIYVNLVSKVSLSIIVFFIAVLLGYIMCIQSVFLNNADITHIERANYGEGDKKYNLEADFEDGCKENIEITLPEKKYSKEEAMQLFTDYYDKVIKKMLGTNESTDNIADNINLIYQIGDIIDIEWNLENTEYIDYTGNILWNNINGKVNVNIEAVFSMGGYSQVYAIPLVIDKSKRNEREKLVSYINKYIEDYSESDKKVVLMQDIDGQKVIFKEKKGRPSLIYIFIGIALAIIMFYIKNREMQESMEKRRKQLEIDYVPIVNKMTVLHNAGITILASWDKIIEDYEKKKSVTGVRFAYEEMKIARKKMKNGMSEAQTYVEYGRRCGIHSYIKFGNLLEQNIRKGTKGLKEILNYEVREAFEERKMLARKKGDEAGTKLLLPMGMMLVISMVIIIVPAFLSVSL